MQGSSTLSLIVIPSMPARFRADYARAYYNTAIAAVEVTRDCYIPLIIDSWHLGISDHPNAYGGTTLVLASRS